MTSGCSGGVLNVRGDPLGNSGGSAIAETVVSFRVLDPDTLNWASTSSWLPASNPVPSMPVTNDPSGAPITGRRDVAAAMVGTKFFVVGGQSQTSAIVGTNQSYDPATNTWTTGAVLPAPRYGAAGASIGGKMYVIGGSTSTGAVATVSVFDPSTNRWTNVASLPQPRTYAAAAVLNGEIYVGGGSDAAGNRSASVWRYSSASGWRVVTALPGARGRFTLTGVTSGGVSQLWALGGDAAAGGTRVDVYDPVSQTWSSGPSLPLVRFAHGIASLNDYLYVIGGLDENAVPQSAIMYVDLLPQAGGGGTPAWQVASSAMISPPRLSFGGQVALIPGGPGDAGILLVGGRTDIESATNTLTVGQQG